MSKILVIEDNLEVRENICEILELANYEVISAMNGLDGIRMALDHSPDLILCDVMMPELDGYGVMKILNKNPKVNHIPLIFVTAKTEKEDVRKGMILGADDYITKPFDDVELLEVIEIRLRKSSKLKKISDSDEDALHSFISEAKAAQEFEDLSLDREVRAFKPKDNIFEEGQSVRWLYYIEEGQVREYQLNNYGKELTTQLYHKGDYFGYTELINGSNHNGFATAVSNTSIRLIPKEDFFKLLYNKRNFAAHFIKMIANRNINTESKLLDLAYGSVRQKVLSALLAYANKTENNNSNSPIVIEATRDEMASMAGTAKETLIRTLSDFRSEGLIKISGKNITIPSLDKLQKVIV